MNWTYLHFILSKFGFPPPIINLIMFCVTSSSLSILWNSVKLPAFAPLRGWRQGNLLSSFLFIFYREG